MAVIPVRAEGEWLVLGNRRQIGLEIEIGQRSPWAFSILLETVDAMAGGGRAWTGEALVARCCRWVALIGWFSAQWKSAH